MKRESDVFRSDKRRITNNKKYYSWNSPIGIKTMECSDARSLDKFYDRISIERERECYRERQRKKRMFDAIAQTCANCHSHLNYRIENRWTNIEFSIAISINIHECDDEILSKMLFDPHSTSFYKHQWFCCAQSIQFIVVMSHISYQFECICHWICAGKCKGYARKYLSTLLIAEINENPTWMARNIIVHVSIGRDNIMVVSKRIIVIIIESHGSVSGESTPTMACW